MLPQPGSGDDRPDPGSGFPRTCRLSRRPGLAERLFSDDERAYAAARGRPAQHLAARFCAKEAVAKALGLQVWNPRDVEVVPAGAVAVASR